MRIENEVALAKLNWKMMNEKCEDITVDQLFEEDDRWNFNDLSYVVPPKVLRVILVVPRKMFRTEEDIVSWGNSTNGNFDSKQAYEFAKQHKRNLMSAGLGYSWICKEGKRVSILSEVAPKIFSFGLIALSQISITLYLSWTG
ncbi:hypothetical protein ACH5RR_026465 [Cinchona calisaya]|uniref:Uncharacterized protein n=1 Tax=Cinchona calisaya TaxID=153742 RepID=A0ABD2Z2M8_9GENT